MASYFDEHNGDAGEVHSENDVLALARLLLTMGIGEEWNTEFERMFGGNRKIPPASAKSIQDLETKRVSPTLAAQDIQCPVCLVEFSEEEELKVLPCNHQFHTKCIITWLQKVCSCPVCRHELPTDDPDYEIYKAQKARAKQREFELETLHNSMFG